MQALIHKNEIAQTGWRLCQVEPDENVFAVAEDLFWVSCADDVKADQFWYDPVDQTIKPNPVQPQPQAEGAQTL